MAVARIRALTLYIFRIYIVDKYSRNGVSPPKGNVAQQHQLKILKSLDSIGLSDVLICYYEKNKQAELLIRRQAAGLPIKPVYHTPRYMGFIYATRHISLYMYWWRIMYIQQGTGNCNKLLSYTYARQCLMSGRTDSRE